MCVCLCVSACVDMCMCFLRGGNVLLKLTSNQPLDLSNYVRINKAIISFPWFLRRVGVCVYRMCASVCVCVCVCVAESGERSVTVLVMLLTSQRSGLLVRVCVCVCLHVCVRSVCAYRFVFEKSVFHFNSCSICSTCNWVCQSLGRHTLLIWHLSPGHVLRFHWQGWPCYT